MNDEIPPGLLQKHPELASVGQVLEQLRECRPITATCITCGLRLLAEEVEDTGALVIRCPDGHTYFRAKREQREG
jgi:hypothetical protein